MEKNGYDVTYITDVDTHENGAQLKQSKAFLVGPHDEYWSWPMFDAVQAARDAGVSLGFFGANAVYRQIRFEGSGSGTAVQLNDTAPTTDRWNFSAVEVLQNGLQSAMTIDQTVAQDGFGTATTPAFSTGGPGELLVAFVGSDGPTGSGMQSLTVSGAGLSWTLAQRTNTQSGTAEVWTAFASNQLTSATVTSTQATPGYDQSLTVVAIRGASRIGATAGANGASGAPTVTVTTTAGRSWVFGVGNDWDQAIARTLGPGQTMLHQWVDSTHNNTFWVQSTTAPTGVADRVVVGYKNASLDPQNPSQYTTVEYRIAPPNRPEQLLMGTMYCGTPTADCGVNTNVDYVVSNSAHWVYANTGFKDGDHVAGIVGYEMDNYWSTSALPSGISNRAILSQSPFTSWDGSAKTANSQIYQAASGAWVFAAGTVSWAWGLDNYWHSAADVRIQQTTANIFNAFTNGAPVASRLNVSAPATATAGQAFTTTVSAVNSQGTVVTGYTGTVHFTSSDAQAVLPADYTFASADAGTHQFSVTLKTSGSQTVTATDTVTSITGSQTVSVGSTTATRLSLTGLTNAAAGTAQTATVTLTDAIGNRATGYTGTVHFTSSDAQAVLPADYTFTSADAGLHQFSVALKTAGSQTVTATDTVTSTLTGNQTVTTSPGALVSLTLAPSTSSITASGSQQYTATGSDQYGNSLGDVTASTTFTIAPNGSCTGASCTATVAGAHTVTGSSSGKTGTASLTVTPGPLTQLTLSPSSATIPAGGSQTYTATGADQYGNSLGDVTASTTFTVAPNGSCTGASCTATVAGAHTVTGSNSGKTAIAGLTVVAAAASHLSLSAPSSAKASQSFQATVTLTDNYGNVATGYTGTVRFTSSDLLASLAVLGQMPTNYTFTSADAGTHTFSVTLVTVGNQTVTVTDTANGTLTDTKTVSVSLL
jgi:hypothetical protein